MRTIRKIWESYKAILPKDASEAQIQETEMAFYAGSTAALKMILDLGRSDISEEAGEAILDSLHQEIRDYSKQLINKSKGAH
jgi:hypothetical protein